MLGPGWELFAISMSHLQCCDEVPMCKWAAQRTGHGTQAVGTDEAERDVDVGGMRWD